MSNEIDKIRYTTLNGIMVPELCDILQYIKEQGHTTEYVIKAELQSTPNTIKFTQTNGGVESVVNFAVDLSAYYTISDIDSMLTGYVKTTGNQSIGGKKTFTDTLYTNGEIGGASNAIIISANADSNTGSYLGMYGSSHGLYPSQFRLWAVDDNYNYVLIGNGTNGTLKWSNGSSDYLIVDPENNRLSWGAWDIITGEKTDQTRDTLYALTRGTYKVTEFTRIKFTTAESPTGTTKAFTCKMVTGLATAVTLIATEFGGTGIIEYRCTKTSSGWTDWTTGYLPLTGGTLSGDITYSQATFTLNSQTNATNTNTKIISGTSLHNGGWLALYNKNYTNYEGQFYLTADNGSNSRSLVGKPDGTLTWIGKPVMRLNTTTAGTYTKITIDANGNVTLSN